MDCQIRPAQPVAKRFERKSNGLLRQYLPKEADLSIYTQEQLDEIAWSLSTA
jgi:transposase, IS30 family